MITAGAKDKLKLCPFCGGKADISGARENKYYVYCISCDAQTSEYLHKTEDQAIAAWNKRYRKKYPKREGVKAGHANYPLGTHGD